MRPPRTRRSVLRLGAAGVGASLAGCSVLGGDESLTVVLRNTDTDSHPVRVRFLDPDDGDVVERFDVIIPASTGEGVGTVSKDDVLDRRPYLVRVEHESSDVAAHYHSYPSCSQTPRDYLRITLHRRDDGFEFAFEQSCGAV